MFYILGRLVNEIRELWDQGPRDYCSQLWKESCPDSNMNKNFYYHTPYQSTHPWGQNPGVMALIFAVSDS